MKYTCLTLKDLFDEYNGNFDGFDSKKPYYQFINEYIKPISEVAIVLEVPEVDNGFNEINKHKLFIEINEWLRDEESIYNGMIEAINEMSIGTAETENRFNDTPQSQGNYNTTEYTSTITTSKSSGSISSAEKKKLLENVRRKTLIEFNRRFVIYES